MDYQTENLSGRHLFFKWIFMSKIISETLTTRKLGRPSEGYENYCKTKGCGVVDFVTSLANGDAGASASCTVPPPCFFRTPQW